MHRLSGFDSASIDLERMIRMALDVGY